MFISEFSKLIAFSEEKASLDAQTLGLLKMAIFLAMDKPDEAAAQILEYKNNGGGQNNVDAVFALISSAKLSYLQDNAGRTQTPAGSSCCS
ncbi:TPA: hypothetical protein L9M38_004964 [Klebsiella quasipneumoniae subsp. quasipneumoniae]|nr:hypothetical protein [Klebsiella quasipneumoniae subsp. quasipneumoniae]